MQERRKADFSTPEEKLDYDANNLIKIAQKVLGRDKVSVRDVVDLAMRKDDNIDILKRVIAGKLRGSLEEGSALSNMEAGKEMARRSRELVSELIAVVNHMDEITKREPLFQGEGPARGKIYAVSLSSMKNAMDYASNALEKIEKQEQMPLEDIILWNSMFSIMIYSYLSRTLTQRYITINQKDLQELAEEMTKFVKRLDPNFSCIVAEGPVVNIDGFDFADELPREVDLPSGIVLAKNGNQQFLPAPKVRLRK